jgi:hypothetical protein
VSVTNTFPARSAATDSGALAGNVASTAPAGDSWTTRLLPVSAIHALPDGS